MIAKDTSENLRSVSCVPLTDRESAMLVGNSISATALAWAQERVLGDVDTFADHLGAACWQRHDVDSDRATRVPGRLEHADDAVVLHAALVAALRDDASTVLEAVRLLAQRHLARRADRVAELAGAQ